MSVQITVRDAPKCQYRVRHAESRDGLAAGVGWKSCRHRLWALDVGGNRFSVRVDGRLYKRTRNTVALYAPGRVYEEIVERGGLVSWRWLLIEEKGVPSHLNTLTGNAGFRIFSDPRQIISRTIEKFVEVSGQKSPARPYLLQSLLYRILGTLFELHATAEGGDQPSSAPAPHPWRKLVWQLLEETGGILRMSRLARELGISASTLTHRYREHCGESVHDSINAWRSEKARILLLDPRRSIKEIATAVGFSHQSYFSIFFREATGSTPRDYRNLSRGR